MRTLYRMITHVVVIFLRTLLESADGTTALRAEIARLQHERDAEKRRADALLTANEELRCDLDDATRLIRQASMSIGQHITESVRATAQLNYLQQRNTYLEACHRHRGAVLAGMMLVRDVEVIQGVDVP